jgi:hypothetical protein
MICCEDVAFTDIATTIATSKSRETVSLANRR